MTVESSDPRAGKWARLMKVSSETEAQLIQGRLESEGIPCTLESLKFHAEPVNFGGLSELRLYVLEQDLGRARALLKAAEDDTDP